MVSRVTTIEVTRRVNIKELAGMVTNSDGQGSHCHKYKSKFQYNRVTTINIAGTLNIIEMVKTDITTYKAVD